MTTETIPAPVKQKKIAYVLTPLDVVTRQDTSIPDSQPVIIGMIIGSRFKWATKECEGYRVPVRALLNSLGRTGIEFVPFDVTPVVAVPPATETGSVGGKVSIDTSPDPDMDGPDGMRRLTVDQRKAVNLLRSKEGFPLGELERPIPPAPPKSAGAGDKTPEYVAWLLRYKPFDFVQVYGVQRVGVIEVTVPGKIDPVSRVRGKATRRPEPGHVIAKRETIYTKVARNQNRGDEVAE